MSQRTRRIYVAAAWLLSAFLPAVLSPLSAGAAPPVEVTTLVDELDGAVGGVAVDGLGNIFVADFGDKVWKISPWGDVEVFVDSLYGTSGNTIEPEGNLLQSNFTGNFLVRVHRDGTLERLASGLEGPVGVTVDSEGAIYFTNCRGNWIGRLGDDGEVEELARSDLFNCPNGLTRDNDDNLYVLNFRDTLLLKVTPEGEVSELARLPGIGGGHVVFTGQELYATTFRGNQVHRVGLEGSVETVAGTGAAGEDDGPGPKATFSSPNGISYDRGRGLLYVNDYLVPFPERTTRRPVSALRRIELPSLTRTLTQALEEGGVEALAEAYRDFKKGRPGSTELETNRLGYTLLQQGDTEAAIRVFELNSETYPGSFNVWDSLAEAHKTAGHRDRAIELYRKSLELNPNNANAVKMLEELGVEPRPVGD
jgi:hypothetical protein